MKIVPGLHINSSRGWPSLSIGGYGASIHVGRRGSGATVGIPETGISCQFAEHKHIHKVVQAEADIKDVHVQGTVKSVLAQAEIIAITKRMGTVAKRLTRNAAGSKYWKKAAIEQAGWLDKMLEVAKASENDQLIAAVQKSQNAWGDGNPHYRAALNSGMTVTEYLVMVLAGKQPDENQPAKLSSHLATPTNILSESAAKETASSPEESAAKQRQAEPLIEVDPFWSAFWKTVGHKLTLPVIGCGVIAVLYVTVAHKTTSPPPVIESATPTPTPEASAAPARLATLAATPTPNPPGATPIPPAAASQNEEVTQGKEARKKHPTHNPTHRPERAASNP